jgi:hypothetical protein
MHNIARQFTVFMENKPGRLAEVAGAMAKAHVSIVALDIPQSSENSLIRLVVDDPGKARSLLKRDRFAFAENEVLMVSLQHEPGTLADMASRLGKAGVNIEYAYGSSGEISGRTRVIIQVSDIMRARKIVAGLTKPAAPPHPYHEKPRYVNREGRSTRRY